MGDLWAAIKLIPKTILTYHDKQIEEENLLKKCDKVIESFEELKRQSENRDREVGSIKNDVKDIKDTLSTISSRLDATQEGVKKELGETLHQWHELGVRRGWLSKPEKDEITAIYNIYCKRLNGNGIGQFYYEELVKLPESKEEKLYKEEQSNV